MSKNVLNFKESGTSSTILELALSKLNTQLDDIARLEPVNENDQDDKGLINITEKERNALRLTFNKLKNIMAELNEQEKDTPSVVNFS